jgi:hypothetical protein
MINLKEIKSNYRLKQKMVTIRTLINNFNRAIAGKQAMLTVNSLNRIIKNRGLKGLSRSNKQLKVQAIKESLTTKSPELKKRAERIDLIRNKGQTFKSLIPAIIKGEKKIEEKLDNDLIKLKNRIIESLNVELRKFNEIVLLRKIKRAFGRDPVVIKAGDAYYTLNENTFNKILNALENKELVMSYDVLVGLSDFETVKSLIKFDSVTLFLPKIHDFRMKRNKDGQIKKKNGGGFFFYTHNLDFDLSRYGIFNEVKSGNYDINCIVRSFEIFMETSLGLNKINDEQKKIIELRKSVEDKYGDDIDSLNESIEWSNYCKVNDEFQNKNKSILDKIDEFNIIVENVKHQMKNRMIPMVELKKLSERNKLYITVKKNGTHKDIYKYGDEETAKYKINLGLIDEHYFLIEKTEFTKFSLTNYESIKHIKDWNKIYMKNKKSNNRFINSFDMINLLLENKEVFLKEITYESNDIFDTAYYSKIKSFSTLKYIEGNCKPMIKEDEEDIEAPKNKKKFKKYFFDFETYVDKECDGEHVPYLCSVVDNENNINTFEGKHCGNDFLKSLKSNSLLIAHNAGYDLRFIIKYLFNITLLEKGNGLICCSGSFKNYDTDKVINIKIKDSLKLIPMSLSQFGECFKLKQNKEVMPYDLYNKETVKKRIVSFNDSSKLLKKSEIKQFKDNIIEQDLAIYDSDKNISFDCVKYSKFYCEMDCKVLKEGYEIFRGWMKKVTDIDIDDVVSLPSLADKFLINTGCYDEVYEFSGVVREFIQKAVVGGRTMTRDNKKWHVKQKLADYDGVSLYPSAMNRIDGFLKGKPNTLVKTQLNYDIIKEFDGYFVQIKITNVKKDLHFPLMSYIDDKTGVRNFSNNMIGKNMIVDKITLEDLIKFQNIEFEILQGYYFNDGRNNKINEVIEFLFNERLKKKKEKNPIQIVYKLIMNSSYGKTIMKPVDTKTVIKHQTEINDFIVRNYDYMLNYTKIKGSQFYKVNKINTIVDHYSRPHVGVEILSMSKRIMNEVMCLAEDKGIIIYYQDTDSMHIEYDKVEILEKSFNEKYGRELTGKQLGQFHIDFELKHEGEIYSDGVYSAESYFLGKKTYYDLLEYQKDDGEIINGDHIRMKGIPSNSIRYKVGKKGKVIDVYEKLFDKQKIEFDILKGINCDNEYDNKCSFKYHNDMSITSNTKFCRSIEIKSEEGVI